MAKISFIFLLLLVAFLIDATEANSCSWGNFYCSRSLQCKSSQWRCDGGRDCTYGEDELNCRTACPSRSTYFRCSNYKCIRRSYLCDGYNDCGDNSDESSYLCGVRQTSSRLRCYSCSTYSSTCSSYTTCPFNYGRGFCYRKTADRTFGGSTSRVTTGGCRSSCTSYDKTNACRNEMNCQLSCCTTSLCNTGSSSGGSSYPSCYTCSSTSSYEDCKKQSTLTRCSSSWASCYKMDYKMSSSNGDITVYKKGCTTGVSSCSLVKSSYCGRISSDKCNVYCCTDSGCNAGSVQRFSVITLLTCAVVFFIL